MLEMVLAGQNSLFNHHNSKCVRRFGELHLRALDTFAMYTHDFFYLLDPIGSLYEWKQPGCKEALSRS